MWGSSGLGCRVEAYAVRHGRRSGSPRELKKQTLNKPVHSSLCYRAYKAFRVESKGVECRVSILGITFYDLGKYSP